MAGTLRPVGQNAGAVPPPFLALNNLRPIRPVDPRFVQIGPELRQIRPKRAAGASDNALLGSTSVQPLAAPLGPGRQIPVFVLLEFLFLPSSFVFYRVGQGSSSNYRRSSEARYGFLPTLIIRRLDLVYPSPSSEPYRSSRTNPACSYSACICRGV